MNFKLSLILVLLGLVVVFIVQNAVTININFLFWSLQTSRALLVIVLLGIGILIGWFLHGIVRFRKKQMRKKKQAATVDKSSSPPCPDEENLLRDGYLSGESRLVGGMSSRRNYRMNQTDSKKMV